MVYSGVLLGGIGVLVETSALQRESFNRAFQEEGIDFEWDEESYAASLSDAGGRTRLAKIRLADGSALTGDQVARVHERKTRLFDEAMVERGPELRPGVAALIARARELSLPLGWASTTSRDNIDAIFEAAGDALAPDMFDFVGDVSLVDRPKPAPDIYRLACERMGIETSRALAIEDSPTGIAAARAAGLEAIAFPGLMTRDQDYAAASRSVRSLDEVVPVLG